MRAPLAAVVKDVRCLRHWITTLRAKPGLKFGSFSKSPTARNGYQAPAHVALLV